MPKTITVTLAAIRAHGPCKAGWENLVKYRGGVKKANFDEPFPLSVVLDSNNLSDTCWCLQILDVAILQHIVRLWLADVLEHAAGCDPVKLLTDAVALLRRYERGEATDDEVQRLCEAADDAEESAVYWAATACASWLNPSSVSVSSIISAAYAAQRASSSPGDERAWQAARLREYLDGRR